MKKLKYTILFFIALIIHSCSLDVVPDNIPTIEEHAFAMRLEAEKVLFTCYSYLPSDASVASNTAFLAGGEFALSDYYGRSKSGWQILTGLQSTSSAYGGRWSNYYQAIAYCNIFLKNIDRTPDMEEAEKERWKCEVEFLKAYYHFELVRMYGPIPIMDEYIAPDADSSTAYKYRNTLDECFKYIVEKMDDVVQRGFLPDKIQNELEELGRITKGIVLATKSKVLVYRASPLFNGNGDYTGFVDDRGIEIFNPTVSNDEKINKWKEAAIACKEAIDFLEAQGNRLYTFDPFLIKDMRDIDVIMMSLRGAVTERYNVEVIWGNNTSLVSDMQIQAYPRDLVDSKVAGNTMTRNNLAVTLNTAESFYSDNGVPIDEDKTWDYVNKYHLTTVPTSGYESRMISGRTTPKFNLNREPRFYGSMGFDGNIWWGQGQIVNSSLNQVKIIGGAMITLGTEHSQNTTGIWPKKLINYLTVTAATGASATTQTYPYPRMRMADLYLLYAEALNESGESYLNVLPWIDIVRSRSGLNGVEASWTNYSYNSSKFKSQIGLREIIKKERKIELAFESQLYWDLKRWKDATSALTGNIISGWNVTSKGRKTAETFFNEVNLHYVEFTPKDYFWPIAMSELRKNPNLIQNYGW